jgi:hypothetical protein
VSKLSPTWPTPRVRARSPRVLAVLVPVAVAGSAVLHRLTAGSDEIAGWLLAQLGVGAVATFVWMATATRVDAGRPGWKQLPDDMPVDPDGLQQRPLHPAHLRWAVPLWLAVTVVAVVLTPDAVAGPADALVLTVLAAVVQALGALAALLVAMFVLWPLALVGIGIDRMDDGGELPPTGPMLVTLGVALLLAVPAPLSVVLAQENGDSAWTGIAVATTTALASALLLLVGYGVRMRQLTRASVPLSPRI